MEETKRHLVLVYDNRRMDPQDFVEIARRIRERAADIEVFIVDNLRRQRISARQAATRPSLVMCPFPLNSFKPDGGKIYQGQLTGKISQQRRFNEIGIPTPKWTVVDANGGLDPAIWGPAVVVKPDFGRSGQNLALVRTEIVREYARSVKLPEPYGGQTNEMFAQSFVDTGNPMSFYRVLSFFSEALYCVLYSAQAPEEISDLQRLPEGGVNIAVNSLSGLSVSLSDAPNVLNIARQVHDALPGRPVLGIDIVVDKATGEPLVLEANPSGNVWHLSSGLGRRVQRAYGFNPYKQFDALTVAADALIRRTRSEATMDLAVSAA